MKTPRISGPSRAFWAGFGVLLLVGILLGVRAERAITAVLSDNRPQEKIVKTTGRGDDALTALDGRDSLLAAALPTERDPFRDPPVKRKPRPAVREKPSVPPPAPPVVKPALRALLYDRVAPSVQLAVGAARSDWLSVGDEFRGWTVLEITENSVTTTQAGDTLVLP